MEEKVEEHLEYLGFKHLGADTYCFRRDDDFEVTVFRHDEFLLFTTYGVDGLEIKEKQQYYSFFEFLEIEAINVEKTFALV